MYRDDDLFFFDEDSDNVTFCSYEMGILSEKQYNNFDKDDSDTLFLSDFWLDVKKEWNEKLMLEAWHSKKMVEFLHAIRWAKRNITILYRINFAVYMQFESIATWYSTKIFVNLVILTQRKYNEFLVQLSQNMY